VHFLKAIGAYVDVEKAKSTKRIRAGKGKSRNRRYKQALGPLIIYREKGTVTRAFRNLPGVELCSVHYLNILQLAPGAHLGRFIIWIEDAFKLLDDIFGTHTKESSYKTGYKPPRSILTNPNITRLLQSYEIQSALKPIKVHDRKPKRKKNPFRNWDRMVYLNPFHPTKVRRAMLFEESNRKHRAAIVEAKRKGVPPPNTEARKANRSKLKRIKLQRRKFYAMILNNKQHPGRLTVRPSKKKPAIGGAAAAVVVPAQPAAKK